MHRGTSVAQEDASNLPDPFPPREAGQGCVDFGE